MIQRAIKKPVEIEFVRWTGGADSYRDCYSFMGYDPFVITAYWVTNKKEIYVDTLEGMITASIGDYIIKGTRGEFYPCKPDVFSDVYEVLNEQ